MKSKPHTREKWGDKITIVRCEHCQLAVDKKGGFCPDIGRVKGMCLRLSPAIDMTLKITEGRP